MWVNYTILVLIYVFMWQILTLMDGTFYAFDAIHRYVFIIYTNTVFGKDLPGGLRLITGIRHNVERFPYYFPKYLSFNWSMAFLPRSAKLAPLIN